MAYGDFYGTLVDAMEYFSNRLHSESWDQASAVDKRKALVGATAIIDTLNYKGYKAPVHTVVKAAEDVNKTPDPADIREAEASQDREFPRGTDTDVPNQIIRAAYEIAFSLLDGKDPEMELETLGISSQGIDSVRTTYARNQVPIEHLINGVPSNAAWRLLRPFLRDEDAVKLVRV